MRLSRITSMYVLLTCIKHNMADTCFRHYTRVPNFYCLLFVYPGSNVTCCVLWKERCAPIDYGSL